MWFPGLGRTQKFSWKREAVSVLHRGDAEQPRAGFQLSSKFVLPSRVQLRGGLLTSLLPESSSSFSAGWAGEEISALSRSNTCPRDAPPMNGRWDYGVHQFSQFTYCALLLFGLTTQFKVYSLVYIHWLLHTLISVKASAESGKGPQ